MNVVLATGNKTIDSFIKTINTINVLTSVNKNEKIVDTVLSRNPHILVLSSDLQGSLDIRNIISKLRTLKPNLKIVFLYGDADNEHKEFIDFLIGQGVYDFILGSINEINVSQAILENATIDDVKPYILNKKEREQIVEEQKQKEKQVAEQEKQNKIEEKIQKKLEVLIVDKIIEKEVVSTQFVGNYKIAVGSLFARAGSTQMTIQLGLFLQNKGIDCCVILNPKDIEKIKSYYMVTDNKIKDLPLYSSLGNAVKHNVIIFDFGKLQDDSMIYYYEQNQKILMCPSSAFEIDNLTEFLRENEHREQIQYCFYPVADDSFNDLKQNLAKGNCIGYKIAYNPSLININNENQKTYNNICKEVINIFSGDTKKKNSFLAPFFSKLKNKEN